MICKYSYLLTGPMEFGEYQADSEDVKKVLKRLKEMGKNFLAMTVKLADGRVYIYQNFIRLKYGKLMGGWDRIK